MRNWWIFLIVFGITLGATLFLTMRQAPIYKAKATYIIKLNADITDAKTISSVMDTLNRQTDLLGTYSEIATSQMIKDQATSRLGINPNQPDLKVSSRPVPDTKILEISVEGKNNVQTRDLVTAVGEATMQYINKLFSPYQLELLDAAGVPSNPSSPRLEINAILGFVLGCFLGLGAMLLSSWVRGDFRRTPQVQVSEGEMAAIQPLKAELEMLQKQYELIHSQLAADHDTIRNTEVEVKSMSSLFNDIRQNGNGFHKG